MIRNTASGQIFQTTISLLTRIILGASASSSGPASTIWASLHHTIQTHGRTTLRSSVSSISHISLKTDSTSTGASGTKTSLLCMCYRTGTGLDERVRSLLYMYIHRTRRQNFSSTEFPREGYQRPSRQDRHRSSAEGLWNASA